MVLGLERRGLVLCVQDRKLRPQQRTGWAGFGPASPVAQDYRAQKGQYAYLWIGCKKHFGSIGFTMEDTLKIEGYF
jgi:hypothetical protein